jgi:hypothetical protein
MRLRHNKKRNTAFVYEALIRELTKSVIKNDSLKKSKIVSIIKEHFADTSLLKKELELYRGIYGTSKLSRNIAEKLISEIKNQYKSLDKKSVFRAQSDLINNINKVLSPSIFNTFVPNYRSIATVYSVFNADMPAKEKVLLEEKILEGMTSAEESTESENKEYIDNLVYKTFVKKFNEKYSDKLLGEQRELLCKYVSSFSDDGLELKVYLNEELGRLKETLNTAQSVEEIASDEEMQIKTKKVSALIESFGTRPVDDPMIESVLKLQQLASEIQEDAN